MASQFDELQRETSYNPTSVLPLIGVALTGLASLMLLLAMVLWV